MAYTAWSVVFGEQPTAAKWNQLGTNDAGFKDGTNIDNDAIIARHLNTGAVEDAKKTTNIAFAVYKAVDQTISSATFTKIIFNTENFDDANAFNPALGDFVAPLAGKYLFTWHAASVGADNVITAIYVNGVTRFRGFWNSTTGQTRSSTGTTVIKLAAGDTISIYAYITGGALTLRGGTDYSQFAGAFLGA